MSHFFLSFVAIIVVFVISISVKRHGLNASEEQNDLDLKCLQLLRATMQHMINKLPQNWETKLNKHTMFVDSHFSLKMKQCNQRTI